MKKTISLVLALIMLCFAALPAAATSYTALIENDGLSQMGDFDSLTDGYIIYFPSALVTSENKYPVAVWANGTFCAPALYADLLKGVAQAGYIVIASPEMMSKSGEAQIEAIDYIFAENEDEDSIFYGKVDCDRVSAFGQSQGGLSSINAALADERIHAVVSIAGASTSEQTEKLKVPTLFLTGTLDWVVTSSDWVLPSYNACTAPAVYASLKNGTHTSFIGQADTYINYTVKWLNAWLYDDGDKSAFTADGDLAQDERWQDYSSKNFEGAAENAPSEETSSGIFAYLAKLLSLIKDFFVKLFR